MTSVGFSEFSGPTLYRIERPGAGQLFTMAAPRGGDGLATDLTALSDRGIDTLVSLLGRLDERWLGLRHEATAAEQAGLRFLKLPTNDFGTPKPDAALATARAIRTDLLADRGVAIHCRAGIGRSSTLAAVVLRLEGVRPDDAWALIGRARGVRVPETQAQRDFVDRLGKC